MNELVGSLMMIGEQLGYDKEISVLIRSFPLDIMYMSAGKTRQLLLKRATETNQLPLLLEVLSYVDQLPKKRKTEAETRKGILANARAYGVDEKKVKELFNQADVALSKVASEKERQEVAGLFASRLHNLLGCTGALVLDGKEVIPAQPGCDTEPKQKMRKLD